MELSLILIYAATAFAVSILVFPVLIKLLRQWKLFDSHTEHKIHQNYTPSMGGVSILLGVGFSLLIALPLVEWADRKFFFIAIALMFITGLRDDILTLTPREKLISQVLPIIILVIFGDTVLSSFYGFLPGFIFPMPLAWMITVFTIVILTNAYNLIDGLDGLAGGVGFLVLLCFGFWFYGIEDITTTLISFSFAGAIAAFLFFNWQPSRIFMGDTGALVIGLLLSYLALTFINKNDGLPLDHPMRFRASIGTMVCVLIIPIFDTLRVIVLRLRKLQSPFRADKNHIHHQFLSMGFSHQKAVICILAINVAFILLSTVLRYSGDEVILPVATGLCLAINQVIKVSRNSYERLRAKSSINKG